MYDACEFQVFDVGVSDVLRIDVECIQNFESCRLVAVVVRDKHRCQTAGLIPALVALVFKHLVARYLLLIFV